MLHQMAPFVKTPGMLFSLDESVFCYMHMYSKEELLKGQCLYHKGRYCWNNDYKKKHSVGSTRISSCLLSEQLGWIFWRKKNWKKCTVGSKQELVITWSTVICKSTFFFVPEFAGGFRNERADLWKGRLHLNYGSLIDTAHC